ncbi:hypothetical protein CVT25_002359 [Psilocybe cyanescens]|uniref:Fungal-type protein kinase domain-containing protein n=1 Tax=Psilocybe cyanescens TaxID=93625 RepID=A0A409WKV3_PSICY|nr:hypothetical protein CVT25_002359 [Psilocybe cyanescens]
MPQVNFASRVPLPSYLENHSDALILAYFLNRLTLYTQLSRDSQPKYSISLLCSTLNSSLAFHKIATTTEYSTKITDLINHIGSKMDDEFIICDIDAFMNAYLPFVPSADHLKSCLETNLETTDFMDKSEIFSLCAFRDTPVIDEDIVGKRTEMDIYGPLALIDEKIGDFDHPDRERNKFKYCNLPSKTTELTIPGFINTVDACFIIDEAINHAERGISTHGMAVPIEQRISTTNKDWLHNNEKMLSANVQIMNDDVRRMFTFGITIEANEMSLWYYSRSHTAVSRPFSFVQSPELLISIFMTFLFATESELGYDPMVQCQDDGRYMYEFPDGKNSSRFYRTVHLISGRPSSRITGRMCRIWLIEEYNPDTKEAGAQAVLKDAWLNATAKTEREIQDALFRDIKDFWSNDHCFNSPQLNDIKTHHRDLVSSEKYRQLFLEIKLDYVGPVLKSIAPNSEPKDDCTSKPGVERTTPDRSRKQYRVLFKEVCRPVGELETLGEAIDVIQQAHTALQLLYCAGWVHKDISSGNILAFRQDLNDAETPWQVKLMDLEYARKFPPGYEASANPKAGTPYFMPTEVLANDYFFVPSSRPKKAIPSDYVKRTPGVTGPNKPIVVHNFQHDLESLWWLVLWLITSHTEDQPSESWHSPVFQVDAIQRCRTWATPIFQNTVGLSTERRFCFIYPLEKNLNFFPKNISDFSWRLDRLRDSMLDAFITRVEHGEIHNKESYAQIHIEFGWFFASIQNAENQDWREYSLWKMEASDSTQRDVNPSVCDLAARALPTENVKTNSRLNEDSIRIPI